ncbi:helix-turn-helix domain-containing protein [Neorhizobium sp. T786]|uniref:helix-turn-helix domain-containing protein n=1 Tax=Pseudorhizobium xiangyangii TaxID=2883104 RepID=UPI001CFF9443|nr:helix-turn-helix domain-containing protein [Neorhizobium xiangyangii]MCB5201817.1 helix-turn-helix domain-containing protein [Neorhizobium xiangyangii]
MHDRPELPSKTDFAVAFKALALVRGLSGDAKTVGAVILSHFNATTGQCDPGTERLMSRAGVAKRTVINATNELNKRGLIVKTRYGGNGFRSSYQPQWAAFRAIVSDFENADKVEKQVQERAPAKCKNVHLASAEPCTLTHIRNSPKELTDSDGDRGNDQIDPVRTASPSMIAARVNGLVRESLRGVHSSHRAPPSVATAVAAASERLAAQIGGLSDTMRARLADVVDGGMRAAAVIEEQKRKGSGLHYLIDRVQSVAPW